MDMRLIGMQVRDEEVFVTASACLGMYLALEAILADGDGVILQAPYFTPYPQQVELARGIPVELATYEEEDFQVNVERLENLITERTKALVINSPNNPTGNCLTTETMREIARIAEAYDLIVISDEIYTAYSYQHPFVPFASLPGNAFGACGEGYLRMACTVDKAVIEEAFARIGRMALFGK